MSVSYIEGFVAAVPAANRDAYARHAADAAPIFLEYGATRVVETWGDDVPEGAVTDFRRAVAARDGEVVVFGWFEYPDKRTRDAANDKMTSDPRMEKMGAMPFDGQRMIYGGFATIVDETADQRGGYVDGFLVPVPAGNIDTYRDIARQAAVVFRDHGAIRVVEAAEDDVPDGKTTDYRRAVRAEAGENVVYSWIEWPSREARDSGMKSAMEDPRLQPGESAMPFDGKRMIFGGFTVILDTATA